MLNNRSSLLLVLLSMSLNAVAADLQFNILLRDAKSNQPIDSAGISVEFIDNNDGDKSQLKECTTSSDGKCAVNASISGGFFSGYKFKWTTKINKKGYSPEYTGTYKKSGEIYNFELYLHKSEEGYKYWNVGEGPSITQYTGLSPVQISSVLKAKPTSDSMEKGRFETEDEWRVRLANAKRKLIAIPLGDKLSKKSSCEVTYDHSKFEYSIKKCKVFTHGSIIEKTSKEGDPVVISNKMDRRSFTRIIEEEYVIDGGPGFVWSMNQKLSPSEAALLEKDLFAAVEVEDLSIVSRSCSKCDERDDSVRRSDMYESIGVLSGQKNGRLDTWMDEVFVRGGPVIEDWKYVVRLVKPSKYYIYSGSSRKLLISNED